MDNTKVFTVTDDRRKRRFLRVDRTKREAAQWFPTEIRSKIHEAVNPVLIQQARSSPGQVIWLENSS